ncbi:putative ribonuclease ZC3H12C [Anopheles darlingi]|uniref:Putative ribonuclease ZC3H12C n=1 Tax=Anopheles darlingi TaxID=43151 RepID=W5J8J6_ANODA|nr:probable ribonuclease ZC3H12C isoform X2 [Anopheles darlingi]ETN59708.1 putative ribonuclease ZC3H12C [Anopheles darlingi]
MLITTNHSQKQFIDSLCTNEAEDSSYDSDCDGDDLSHEQVSRTTSDTLGQEFAEYVNAAGGVNSQQQQQQHHLHHHHQQLGKGDVAPVPTTALPEHSPGYQQRVEFALKLGYTERLVQAALQRLGPNPAQNELLAELIKLGSQPGAKGGNEFSVDHHALHGAGEPVGIGGPTYYPLVVGGSTGDMVGTTGGLPSTGVSANTIGGSGEVETLRSIVIDGSNVAMSHGNKEVFSCRGIRLCVDWFKNRGHKEITVFVPKWRKESSRPDNPVKDGEILNELEKERMLVFTPSRLVGGKRMVCYDDRYILKLAAENDGIVVSNDNYRDLVQESSEFKKVVEERVLMYSFVNDRFMPPDDPLGRSGPTLDNFLRVQPRKGDPPPPCPYGKKCTYGNKCKFYHPERGSQPHKSVTERLSEYAARHLQARSGLDPSAAGVTGAPGSGRSAVQGKSLSVPLSNSSSETSPINDKRKALCRTRSNVPSDSSGNNLYAGGTEHMMLHAGHPHHPGVRPPQPQQMPFLSPPPGAVVSSRTHAWDLSTQQQPHGHGSMVDVQPIFPKSHSIENISNEPFGVVGGGHVPASAAVAAAAHHSAVGCYGAPPMWNLQQQQLAPPQSQQSSQQQHATVAGGSVSQPALPHDTVEHGSVDSVNLHRKLQRQLTLNPAGCDPRIYQMQRHQQQHQQSQQSQSSPQQQQQQSHHSAAQLSPHRPLAPSLSGGARPSPQSQWELHQHVQRIASAPDSVRPWHNGPPPASSSEPHINLGWSPNPVPPTGLTPSNSHSVVSQQQHQHQQQHHQQQHQQQQQQQHDRQRLHYHLASIFPEEQVQTVMQMYPDETNPQKICAAILAMFPKM